MEWSLLIENRRVCFVSLLNFSTFDAFLLSSCKKIIIVTKLHDCHRFSSNFEKIVFTSARGNVFVIKLLNPICWNRAKIVQTEADFWLLSSPSKNKKYWQYPKYFLISSVFNIWETGSKQVCTAFRYTITCYDFSQKAILKSTLDSVYRENICCIWR